jgi:hypothetical protein
MFRRYNRKASAEADAMAQTRRPRGVSMGKYSMPDC